MSLDLVILPYFEQPGLHMGPVTVHAFGILLVSGILTARYLILRRAERVGPEARLASTLCVVMLIRLKRADRAKNCLRPRSGWEGGEGWRWNCRTHSRKRAVMLLSVENQLNG